MGEVWDVKLLAWDELGNTINIAKYTPDLLAPIVNNVNGLKDKIQTALVREQLLQILQKIQWWKRSSRFTQADKSLVYSVEEGNVFAGPRDI